MSEDWRPAATLATLQCRAGLLARTRAFFAERGVLEVDVPILQGGGNLDPGIEPIAVALRDGRRWLPTSPEHPLKRLVAAGYGPVWALAPAGRAGEWGRLHAPEFRMLEWYRPGWSLDELMREVGDLLTDLTGDAAPLRWRSYRAVFRSVVGCDPFLSDIERLRAAADDAPDGCDRDALCDWLFASRVQPTLGVDGWEVVADFPPALAAQARLRRDGEGAAVAARCEVFRRGIELANAYDEETDAVSLRERQAAEAQRQGLPTTALDAHFHAAMAAGMPACSGVAVGFDRVVMLACGCERIDEVQAFPWQRA